MVSADDIHRLVMKVRPHIGSKVGYRFDHLREVLVVAATARMGDIDIDNVNWARPYTGSPTEDFWTFWKAGKESLKGWGFRVYKDDGDDWAVQWTYTPPYSSIGIWEPDPPPRPLY